MHLKLPPPEKIYEAYSVLADKRFELIGPGHYRITSSSSEKHYNVRFDDTLENIAVASDDNGTRWQGYSGYPIIAVLMITGKLNFNQGILSYFKNIQWNALNKLHKNNYALVVEIILNAIENKNEIEKIKQETLRVFSQLEKLHLLKLVSSGK